MASTQGYDPPTKGSVGCVAVPFVGSFYTELLLIPLCDESKNSFIQVV